MSNAMQFTILPIPIAIPSRKFHSIFASCLFYWQFSASFLALVQLITIPNLSSAIKMRA
jgi:hypothetical protein